MTASTNPIVNAVLTVTAFMRSHRCRTIGQAYDLPEFPIGALRQALPGYEYPEISGLTARRLRARALRTDRAAGVQRFYRNGRGTGATYTCHLCDKLTRDTGAGEQPLQLCRACFEQCEVENAHQDGHHQGAPDASCPMCQAELEAKRATGTEHEPGECYCGACMASAKAAWDKVLPVEPEAEHSEHVQPEAGCVACEAERAIDGVWSDGLSPHGTEVACATLQAVIHDCQAQALADLLGERRWLLAAAEEPRRALDHRQQAAFLSGRAEGWRRAAEVVQDLHDRLAKGGR